jgi:hypothetical protein
MTLWQFEMAVFTLTRLDMQELVDAGAIDDRDYATGHLQCRSLQVDLMNPARARLFGASSAAQEAAQPDG